ncbi:MAG: type II secretion system protein, partial [Halobacteriaceae archaeon]
PGSGWTAFGAAWREWAPGLGRAVGLLAAAFEAPEGQRERLLDRALSAALGGTRDRVAAFAAAIRGPTTALYAFGVVLPLALVATLPAARAAGVPLPLSGVVAVYDLLLPAGLLAGGGWLLGRQPAAFPAVRVPRDHPDVPDRRLHAAALGIAAAALSWVGAPAVVPAWTRWVVAPGWGVGVAGAVYLYPVVRVREQVAAVERGLPDALAVAGQHLAREAAPGTAIAAAGEELDGAAAERFAEAARVQRRLGLGVEASFREGAFADLPSPRAQAAVSLLALAGREGPHGGRVLVELADHLEELLAVERDARRALATTTGTLRNTACCFAPLIGGTTVALAGRIDGLGSAPAVPTAGLGIAVGVYVLLLAAALAGLAAALETGVDSVRIGYRAARTVAIAATAFPVAVRAAGLLV